MTFNRISPLLNEKRAYTLYLCTCVKSVGQIDLSFKKRSILTGTAFLASFSHKNSGNDLGTVCCMLLITYLAQMGEAFTVRFFLREFSHGFEFIIKF